MIHYKIYKSDTQCREFRVIVYHTQRAHQTNENTIHYTLCCEIWIKFNAKLFRSRVRLSIAFAFCSKFLLFIMWSDKREVYHNFKNLQSISTEWRLLYRGMTSHSYDKSNQFFIIYNASKCCWNHSYMMSTYLGKDAWHGFPMIYDLVLNNLEQPKASSNNHTNIFQTAMSSVIKNDGKNKQ